MACPAYRQHWDEAPSPSTIHTGFWGPSLQHLVQISHRLTPNSAAACPLPCTCCGLAMARAHPSRHTTLFALAAACMATVGACFSQHLLSWGLTCALQHISIASIECPWTLQCPWPPGAACWPRQPESATLFCLVAGKWAENTPSGPTEKTLLLSPRPAVR